MGVEVLLKGKEFNNVEPEQQFNKKYRAIINILGYENVKRCIPFKLTEIKNMYDKDEHMNFNMKKWDNASAIAGVTGQAPKPYYIHNELYYLLRNKGVKSWSQCEGVCILKECARMWLEEEGLI